MAHQESPQQTDHHPHPQDLFSTLSFLHLDAALELEEQIRGSLPPSSLPQPAGQCVGVEGFPFGVGLVMWASCQASEGLR